jgi:hypothetical protein
MKNKLRLFTVLLLAAAGASAQARKIISPKADSAWARGRAYTIQWTHAGAAGAPLTIRLVSPGAGIAGIAERVPDSGLFAWQVPGTLAPGPYTIRIESIAGMLLSESGVFRVVAPPLPRNTGLAKPGLQALAGRESLLRLAMLPPSIAKPDFAKMDFDFIDSRVHADMLPPWFILKFQGHADKRYFKYVYRLRGKEGYLDYIVLSRFKESAAAKEVTVEKQVVRPLAFLAPKYARESYRRDAYEKIIQLLTYRRYLLANGYFESAWDRVSDFFTDLGNLLDLVLTVTEAVFGDVDYARIAKLSKNFYQDCIEIKNEDLYKRCVTLWYEINDLIQWHRDEVQFDYCVRIDGVFNRVSTVCYLDLLRNKPITI